MKTSVDIISGFLGAGKTTLLNQMLKTAYKGKRIAIIENEFGDVTIDKALLPSDMSITEMTNGCACCTIRVGLIEGLLELISLKKFDRIVIEPTGVAKLSEMLSILQTKQLNDIAQKGIAITVVNPIFHGRYSQTLGDFYLDQLKYSDAVYVNRVAQLPPDSLMDIMADIKLVSEASIFTDLPKNILTVLIKYQSSPVDALDTHHHDYEAHAHHHDANHAFSSMIIKLSAQLKQQEIDPLIDQLIADADGEVLRIKGFVQSNNGSYLVQWIPGELNITPYSNGAIKLEMNKILQNHTPI